MSHKKKAEEEDNILNKVKEILNLKEKTKKDEALQTFVKFIFTKEFKQTEITLPAKRRDKEAFNFVQKYIELIHSLFQLEQKERTELYDTNPGLCNNSNIRQITESLNKLIDKKYEDASGLAKNEKNLLNKIKQYLLNIISHQPISLFSQIDKYHFYFIFYTPSICVVKLLLYSILFNKFQDVLNKFSYSDFCPDLENEMCQNLIILFFDNIKNEKRELLFIFALLIFQFQRIFNKEEYTNISKYTLQYSAKKTYEYLKPKGLKCPLLFECTYTKFLYYLDNTITQLNQKKLKNQISNLIINNNSKLNSSNLLPISNEIRPFPSDKNNKKKKDDRSYDDSPKSKISIDNDTQLKQLNENKNQLLPKSNQIHPFPIEKNNTKCKDDKNYDNSHINNLPKDDQILEEKKAPNNIILLSNEKKEDNKEQNIKAINLENEIVPSLPVINTFQSKGDIKNIDSSMKTIIPHDNNFINSIKNKINEPFQENIAQNKDADANTSNLKESNEEIFKADFNLSNDQINSLTSQQLFSLIKMQHDENQKRLSEQEEKISKITTEFETKISKITTEFETKTSKLEEEIKTLKNAIGTIQIRSLAKNFLKIFKNDLSREEKAKIKEGKTNRGKVTSSALKRKYSLYINNENFKIVDEIVEKSGASLNKGNSLAHTLNMEDYLKEIEMFKEKYNLVMIDHEKMEKFLFLILIGISDNTISNCFDFTVRYLDKEMKLGFSRNDDNIDTFIQSK